ncbi:MAG: LuxR C-terminal-related transcriptional regulator, partial [Ruminococcus sp.]
KEKISLNSIYISERLQKSLQPVSNSALTAITAPMGYGKTTAVNWYLSRLAKDSQALLIRISIYSQNLSIFWKSVQNAFSFAGLNFLENYDCPEDEASAGFLTEILCYQLEKCENCYIFIDDFHLLKDDRVATFLCRMAGRIPENVHLIVASRNHFISDDWIVRLGGRLHRIEIDDLRLNAGELSAYIRRCGTSLTDSQLEQLLKSSEGWFAAVYLNLCSFSKSGELPGKTSDIYQMFSASMLNPLPEDRKEFLSAMGLADEFTEEMAEFITKREDVHQILKMLTRQNAFVTCLNDGQTYRFHHMMKECAFRAFRTLDDSRQAFYYERYGAWYEKHGAYIHALSAYRRNQNFAAILRVVQKDAGILLASLKPEEVLEVLNRCPVSVLKEYPLAILVLMRCMFNWKNIPKMLELKELLLASIREHPKLSEEERGNLLGECDLIQSFLMYNDISRMSQFHRSASEKMTRPAISIRSDGGWTFGSPSVLMMFHRKSGDLDKELEEMNQCMPHYYKITNGHGQGAETIMSAEAHFMRGNFVDAHIALEKAYTQIQGNGQESIALCCDFLAQRLSICMDIKMRNTFEERRKELLQGHNTTWVNIFDSTCAYYYAVTGQTERIPTLFGAHMLSTVNFLAPGRPMMEMIENQVYLAQGEYSKVIGRSESILAMCQALHYDLVALHVQIQFLAANWKLGKTEQALDLLRRSLSQAFPDGILMPFVENYPYIEELLKGSFFGINENFLFRITRMGKEWEMRCDQLKKEEAYPPVFKVLSDRELEITELMAKHMSNKEIAQSLFLSEGTVKQYINQIYSKLQIPGDVRVKRKYLLEMMEGKS